eukprot:CAMPEP_0114323358 /NCGR_PEP_ID=MMETSP0059-20121206/27815_1 /TAXON_ID=36894 /ORGANISM="Pyramimonas parkeae, Strain CCMP726" /LENGTH=126 /DNA_ID=CAMNT_0001451593 /DNA_START=671 /DNA_END=1051 /DNA_ORIENTATION=+
MPQVACKSGKVQVLKNGGESALAGFMPLQTHFRIHVPTPAHERAAPGPLRHASPHHGSQHASREGEEHPPPRVVGGPPPATLSLPDQAPQHAAPRSILALGEQVPFPICKVVRIVLVLDVREAHPW